MVSCRNSSCQACVWARTSKVDTATGNHTTHINQRRLRPLRHPPKPTFADLVKQWPQGKKVLVYVIRRPTQAQFVSRQVLGIAFLPIDKLRRTLRMLDFPVEHISNITYASRSVASFIMHPTQRWYGSSWLGWAGPSWL